MKHTLFKKAAAAFSTMAVAVAMFLTVPVTGFAAELPSEPIREVTSDTLHLKVGDTLLVNADTIDPLLSNSGLDITGHAFSNYHPVTDPAAMDGYPVISVYDSNYMSAGQMIGLCNDDGETLLFQFYTEEEANKLIEDWRAGTLTYNGVPVTPVEEGTGYIFRVRADKAGTTSIVIPKYYIHSNKEEATVKVTIPVVIEENPDNNANTTTNSSITSATDSAVSLNNENGILPSGTTLSSAKLESGEVYTTAKNLVTDNIKNLGNYAVYELNLFDSNQAEIHQLNGKVAVTMNLPFTLSDGSTLKVYRVDGNTLVECTASVTDGKVTFETDHFSTYVFVEQKAVIQAPKTGDPMMPMSSLFISILCVAGLCVAYKKHLFQ